MSWTGGNLQAHKRQDLNKVQHSISLWLDCPRRNWGGWLCKATVWDVLALVGTEELTC